MTLVTDLREAFQRHKRLVAVVDGSYVVTYAELAERGEDLAQRLIECAPGPGSPVAGRFPRGLDAIVFTVAAIFAGRPFVHLDPQLSQSQAEAVLDRLDVGAVVARDGDLLGIHPRLRTGGSQLGPASAGDRPSYFMLTSGTTSVPKCVIGGESALHHYLQWQRTEFEHTSEDRFSSMAPPWFDFSFKETLAALFSGASVMVAADDVLVTGTALADWLQAVEPTVVCLLPSRFAQLLAVSESGVQGPATWWRTVRQLLISGEVLRPGLIGRWQEVVTGGPWLTNLYGPTESTVIKLRYRIPSPYRVTGASVPIGSPIDGATVELLPLDGASGQAEICVRSDDLSLGYVDDLGSGATRFEDVNGERILHTGDLGRRLADGNIEFLGRIDSVIKRRGVAVDLAGLEAALSSLAGIREVAAVVVTAGSAVKVGLFYSLGPGVPPSSRAVREHLLGRLEISQMPEVLRALPQLPLTDRGKIDRANLAGLAGLAGVVDARPGTRPDQP